MAFGQQSGPPATHRQMQDLLELVIGAGHVDLRDARGPLGLTQRQANGKFTRDEADVLIEQLQAEADVAAAAGDAVADAASAAEEATAEGTRRTSTTAARSGSRSTATRRATPRPKTEAGGAVAAARARREAEAAKALREASDELLAAELQRRGWVVMEP